jgi:hypothetical protein
MAAPSKLVKYALAAFVAASIGAAAYKAMSPAGPAAAAGAAAAPAPEKAARAGQKTAVVYYFHTTARCYSCNLLEKYAREAVAAHFAQPYKGWQVEFRSVNLDDEANDHFARLYGLNSKSVVVQKFDGEKALNWGLLGGVWQLLGDQPEFAAYIAAETRKLLDAK